MKVILLRDVARIGKKGSVVVVPDGFALNQLIPKGDAKAATPENIKAVKATAERKAEHKLEDETKARTVSDSLKVEPLEIIITANNQGHLFKAVSVLDVEQSLLLRGFNIPKEWLSLPETIKQVGGGVFLIKAGGQTFSCDLLIKSK